MLLKVECIQERSKLEICVQPENARESLTGNKPFCKCDWAPSSAGGGLASVCVRFTSGLSGIFQGNVV